MYLFRTGCTIRPEPSHFPGPHLECATKIWTSRTWNRNNIHLKMSVSLGICQFRQETRELRKLKHIFVFLQEGMSTSTRKFLRPSHRKLARVSKEHEHCPETWFVFAMGHVVCSSTWFFLTPMVTYDQVIAKRQFVLYGKMLVISCEMVMDIKLLLVCTFRK